MNRKQTAVIIYTLMAISLSGILISSCSEGIREGSVVFTQLTGKTEGPENAALDSWRYKVQSHIAVINPENTGKSYKVLTSDFYSALAPEISYDGKFLLFAGQLKQNDPWQIWEMNLGSLKVRQVITVKEDCTDPQYLPGGRLVFSRMISGDTAKAGHSLFTCNLDGSNLQEVTFDPAAYSSLAVLKDGRVLAVTRKVDPENNETVLMALRPDGTKSELFYSCKPENTLISQPCETADGKILFIESSKNNYSAGNLISVKYNRPLHSRISYSSEIKGSFRSVSSLNSGKLLVLYSPSENEKYSIFEFDAENKTIGKPIYSSTQFDAAEAVVVEKHGRPKKLPSEVDPGVKTGLLLCQDINFQGLTTSTGIKAGRIEIVGADSSLGVISVEKDGSVYLKIIADTPFRIRRIDENGNVVGKACNWIYLRPNERRGCIGCHEDNEMVPDNRLALAVKKAPLTIPVHKSNQKEKAIELE
jgi:hypothetical protein